MLVLLPMNLISVAVNVPLYPMNVISVAVNAPLYPINVISLAVNAPLMSHECYKCSCKCSSYVP